MYAFDYIFFFCFFFFKQKTAYEMRISDWSSDVCSSDLNPGDLIFTGTNHQGLGPLQDGDDVRLEIETVGTLCVRVRDPLNRSWPREIDTAMAARVLEMLHTQTPPGAHRPDRKSTRLNSSHSCASRMPSSA